MKKTIDDGFTVRPYKFRRNVKINGLKGFFLRSVLHKGGYESIEKIGYRITALLKGGIANGMVLETDIGAKSIYVPLLEEGVAKEDWYLVSKEYTKTKYVENGMVIFEVDK